MSLTIIDADPKPEELPKRKKIVIDGVEVGEAEPSICRDELRWHVVIDMRKYKVGCFLVQGFGNSVRAAIADGIVRARRERDSIIDLMNRLESACGVAGLNDDDLLKTIR